MLTDFYGKVLIAPTVVDHRRDAFDHALAQISQVTASFFLLDSAFIRSKSQSAKG